jgi:prepilin-type processing-associated H-X9-DG protein
VSPVFGCPAFEYSNEIRNFAWSYWLVGDKWNLPKFPTIVKVKKPGQMFMVTDTGGSPGSNRTDVCAYYTGWSQSTPVTPGAFGWRHGGNMNINLLLCDGHVETRNGIIQASNDNEVWY